ncbi:MAG: hypothetical protein JWO38_5394 [Gemmataceae bacterium]|nr:hypothetical protein [Gemmataceae bacterium]
MRKFIFAVCLVGAALVGAPSQASAAFQIALQEAGVLGGARTTVASGPDFTTASFTGTYGDFTVKVFSGASDNGADLSDLLSSTTSVTNNSNTTKTLTLYVSQTNYTLPAGGPLELESGLGGSKNQGTTVTLANIFRAYADKHNNLFGTADQGNGPQSAVASGNTFDTGSATSLFHRLGVVTPYSLTSVITLQISAGGKVGFSAHENLTPTPAPAGLALALAGMPFLGLGAWVRRRQAKAQNS